MLLGLFFWLPFWAFFNLCALYVDGDIDTAALYTALAGVFGVGFAGFLSRVGDDGVRRVLGEAISHTGYIIMILQVFVSGYFVVLGYAAVSAAAPVFLGIFLFAVGEMMASPRIQEYITWIAPKDKAA